MLVSFSSLDTYGAGYGIVVILHQAFPFPVTSLATSAADSLQIYCFIGRLGKGS